jgi:LruC domain-containing protein
VRTFKRHLLTLSVAGLASIPAAASAQDSDGDGVANAADAFPCDATRASVSYFPGQSTSALIAFEDQWPGHTDVDYNDVALRAHYRLERNAAGNVVQLHAVIDPVALGGDLSNGLGLQLPTSRTGVSVRRRLGGGAWQSVALEADANATMVLSSNLRELFGSASGRINSRANEARLAGQRLEVEVTFATPAAISQAAAPFDVFVFRSGNLAHQIHFPQYAGTAAMNAALFNSDQDTSTSTRRFVTGAGVPAALNLMTTTRYPLEGVGISALFPDIAGFASSGGASNTAFYASNVVAAQGHDVAALALPAVGAASTACLVGATAANPGVTCRDLLAQMPGAPSGTYYLDPCGTGTPALFRCDMTTNGGGWTLAGQQNASATTTMGTVARGTAGVTPWSSPLLCVGFTEIMVFNTASGQSFRQSYGSRSWTQTAQSNFAIGGAGTAFKHGTYGSPVLMGCVNYAYNAGVYPEYACDNDGQRGQQGHIAGYAGEFCSGGRLDGTWAWTDGVSCSLRGVDYVWGYGVR